MLHGQNSYMVVANNLIDNSVLFIRLTPELLDYLFLAPYGPFLEKS